MRSKGQDIVEIFGFASDDTSLHAVRAFKHKNCPFIGSRCNKTNHDQSAVYGTCSVTGARSEGVREEVIICPKRLYADNYRIFGKVTEVVWGQLPVIAGGNLQNLKSQAMGHKECVIAFGQNSGREVSVNSYGKLSMDWVLQRYRTTGADLVPVDFVGIEIQSIDITGNYREIFNAYSSMKEGMRLNSVPSSGHGLNWANVHKRLIPQIIRKGNVYSKSDRCVGFFFILPEQVYKKFDEVLGDVSEESNPSKTNLSVLTYVLDDPVEHGKIRDLRHTQTKHHSLINIATAFSTNSDPAAPKALERTLRDILMSDSQTPLLL